MWPPKGRPPFVDSYSAGAATDAATDAVAEVAAAGAKAEASDISPFSLK